MAGSKASEGSRDLVQRLRPSLRRFAYALVGGGAKSAAAEALLEAALDRQGALRGPSEAVLKTSLYGAIVTANRLRVAGRGADAGPFRTPVRGVAQGIERLPLDQREVLLLIVLEQFSYDQAATILAMPRSSVVARLMRARAAIAGTEEAPHHRPSYLRLVK